MNETTHRINPGLRYIMLLCGAVLAVAALYGASILIFGRPHIRSSIVTPLLLVTALGGLGALGCLWSFLKAGRYSVTLSEHGVRVGDSRWLAWPEIARLRERPVLQRVDLLDSRDLCLASVDYQINRAEYVLQTIRDRVRGQSSGTMPLLQRFGERFGAADITMFFATFLLLFGMSLWIWLVARHWVSLVLLLGFAWLFYDDAKSVVRQLDLTDRELVLHTFLTTTRIPRERVAAVALELKPVYRGSKILAAAVHLADGSKRFVAPPRTDASEVHRAVSDWHRRGAAA